jgi:4-hydroxy-tetrahydrodipicolinate reductase
VLNIIISGVNGAMGKALRAAIENEKDMWILAGFDREPGDAPLPFKLYHSPEDCGHGADAVIDFSHFSATPDLMAYCVRTKSPAVVATTALGDAELALLREAAETIPVFRSANMSLGINLLSRMARMAMPALEADFNVEITEKHHNKKKDSPSGTALLLAEAVNGSCRVKKDLLYGRRGKSDECKITDLGIHAIRGGSVPGEHTLLFLGPDEVIEIKHTVFTRNVFALGAIRAARFISGKAPGLYDMDDLINAAAEAAE